MEYTTVIGVDAGHLEQLRLTWPTWAANKPSLLKNPVVCFYDVHSVHRAEIHFAIDPKPISLTLCAWPLAGMTVDDYGKPTQDKWTNPQRVMMLSGFIPVAAAAVSTPYWLKLDLDVVATGVDDWIDPVWFVGDPAIVSQKWHYTKPSSQVLDLDAWVCKHIELMPEFLGTEPLNLIPAPGSSLVKHKRIISWCGFFGAEFTKLCRDLSKRTCAVGHMPVPSQDGFMFYTAKRLGLSIRMEDMKARGWRHTSGGRSLRDCAHQILGLL